MTRKDYVLLAESLHRTMPVKGCHSGRGWIHSESCFDLCYDSWLRCVQDVAHSIYLQNKRFNREQFRNMCEGKIAIR